MSDVSMAVQMRVYEGDREHRVSVNVFANADLDVSVIWVRECTGMDLSVQQRG